MRMRVRVERGKAWKFVLLLIAILAVVQLACFSVNMGINIIPEGPDYGRMEFMVIYQMTDEYVQAAKKANQELRADYIAAGETPPDSFLPESFDDMEEGPDFSQMAGENSRIVSQTPTEIVAEGSLRYGPGEEPIENFGLSVVKDEAGWSHYILTTELMEFGDDETIDGLDNMRAQSLGEKPPVVPKETESATGGELMGMMGLFEELGNVSDSLSLEAWYMQRVLLEAGLPVYIYNIQMPGSIQSHTVDNKPAGQVDDSGAKFTLVIDEDFLRQYGPGKHSLQIESAVHPCLDQCASGPHWIWDEQSDADNCGCICEQGWKPDENGDCVACDDYCMSLDPRAIEDPAASAPNSCACRCNEPLMIWDESGKCVCSVGAEPDGQACKCKEGWELNPDGTGCVPGDELASEDKLGNCDTQAGMDCFKNSAECFCPKDKVCDIWSNHKDSWGCSYPVAAVIISPGVTNYQRWWIADNIQRIQQFYRAQGYRVEIVQIQTGDEVGEILGNPSTRALAYFGHARTPTIESSNSTKVASAIYTSVLRRYRTAGLTLDQAQVKANERSNNPNLDYAYMHTCHSLDDNSMRDYLVKPGGTFWGKRGILWAFQDPTQTTRPTQ